MSDREKQFVQQSERPEAIETPNEKAERILEQLRNPFARESFQRLTPQEREVVFDGASRLAKDMRGAMIISARAVQTPESLRYWEKSNLGRETPEKRHQVLSSVSSTNPGDSDSYKDLTPKSKFDAEGNSFAEWMKDSAEGIFGDGAVYSGLDRLLCDDALDIVVMPLPGLKLACIYTKFVLPGNTTPVEKRPTYHNTLFVIRTAGEGRSLEILDNEQWVYLSPQIMQLTALMVTNTSEFSAERYFDTPFGKHVFRESKAITDRSPEQVIVTNFASHRVLHCKNSEGAERAQIVQAKEPTIPAVRALLPRLRFSDRTVLKNLAKHSAAKH